MDEKIPSKLDKASGRVLFSVRGTFLYSYWFQVQIYSSFLFRSAALAIRPRLSTMSWCFLMCHLFTIWLLCLSCSSSCSTGYLPLWLFCLVALEFREKFDNSWENSATFWKWTPRRHTTVLSCNVMAWHGTLALRSLADSYFSWIWLAETNYPILFLILTLA